MEVTDSTYLLKKTFMKVHSFGRVVMEEHGCPLLACVKDLL